MQFYLFVMLCSTGHTIEVVSTFKPQPYFNQVSTLYQRCFNVEITTSVQLSNTTMFQR